MKKKKKKKKAVFIVTIIVLVAMAAGFGAFAFLSSRTKFNDEYVRGNTAGNLYNGGYFCEYDGTVYFSNPSDGGMLYSMDTDGRNLKKLSSDIPTFINADENYLYYVRNNLGGMGDFSYLRFNTDSLCRLNRKDGSNAITLDAEPCLYSTLVGNKIYYIHYEESTGSTLYEVSIDGSNKHEVISESAFPCSTDGKYVYYGGMGADHNLYRIDSETDQIGTSAFGGFYMPTIIDTDTVYFIDSNRDYTLSKMDLETQEVTTVCPDRVDWYNVNGNYIYFQRTESPALCRMRTDGSEYLVLCEGVYSYINVTSTYIYFQDYETEETYRILNSANAKENVTPELFAPGK